jgi:hypothetical protein
MDWTEVTYHIVRHIVAGGHLVEISRCLERRDLGD